MVKSGGGFGETAGLKAMDWWKLGRDKGGVVLVQMQKNKKGGYGTRGFQDKGFGYGFVLMFYFWNLTLVMDECRELLPLVQLGY